MIERGEPSSEGRIPESESKPKVCEQVDDLSRASRETCEKIFDLRLLGGHSSNQSLSFSCFCVLFDLVYGILFEGHIHHTKFTKMKTKTQKREKFVGRSPFNTLPRPPHETTENQRNARKGGTGVDEWGTFCFQKMIEDISFLISGCGDATPARSVPRWRYLIY